jgi:two-component system, chemotaxis family, chemotaxis protein CheY
MGRVLVVEDDLPIATLIADELRHDGHLVDVVANGADALESLQASRPDVVVLDLMLPVMHGWEFIERYREVTHGQEIPIVVVSAAGAVTRSMEALGVRCFLQKPFEVADLVDAVEDVLAEHWRRSPAS